MRTAFRNAFDERRLDLASHRFLERESSEVVLVSPAPVPDRSDIHDRDLDRLLLRLCSRDNGEHQREAGKQDSG